MSENNVDSRIISYDADNHVLLVGKRSGGQYPDILKAYEGSEAEALWDMLLDLTNTKEVVKE